MMIFERLICIGLTCLLLLAGGARAVEPTSVPEAPHGPFNTEVDKAIRRAMDFLRTRQNADGSWTKEPNITISDRLHPPANAHPDPDGGRTGLVTLALLSAGEDRSSPIIVKALEFLQKQKARMTYSRSMRAAVLSMIGASKREALRADVRALIEMGFGEGPNAGLYTYGLPTEAGTTWVGERPDLSNSQYAALGVWYATGAGVPVSRDYWKRIEGAWQGMQNADGGWPYLAGKESTASMTAAGLTVMFITQDFIRVQDALMLGKPYENKHIDAGLAWLEKNFSIAYNAGKDSPVKPKETKAAWGKWRGVPHDVGTTFFVHYMLYGYERVGEASGLTRFGEHVWFDQGARFLIETQSDKGSWWGSGGEFEDTAFGLLFLARGRDPVPLQKLQSPGRWNNRPRDASRMIQWLRQQIERHVNWQVVNIDQPLEDLQEAPVLYAASNEPLVLDDAQTEKLRQYLLQGGLLLTAQEGGSKEFANSVVALAAKMFPGYAFRNLPADHFLLKGNFQVKDLESDVQALSNGVRELIVLLPNGDLPARWHSPAAAVQASRESPCLIVGNLIPYSNGRSNPKYKGEHEVVTKDLSLEPERRVNVARIKIGANWNPEPYAWDRLATLLWNDQKVDVRLAEIVPGGDVGFGNRVKLAHLTATDPIELSLQQDKALRDFIRGGGTLLVDVAGGSRDTGNALENILQRAFIGELIKPIPIDHPLYTGAGFGGKKITEVTYRRWADEHLPRTRLPRLLGIFVDGRLGVIFSKEDLTFGLTGAETDGVIGYSPESAVDLMRNAVLFAGFANPAKN